MSYYGYGNYREDSIGPVQCEKPLLSKLRSFYYKHAVIDKSVRTEARRVLEKIIEKFEMYTRSTSVKYEFGDLIRQGSSFEGLRVTKPIEFDLLVPINLNGQAFLREMKEASGYYFIYSSDDIWKKCIIDGMLSPIKINRRMQAVVNDAIEFMKIQLPGYDIKMRDQGAAKRLRVKHGNLTIDIDLVPAVKLQGGEYLVAKRHYLADHYHSTMLLADNKFNHIWRMSYSEQEKEVINRMDEVHRACLKILKAIAASDQHRSQFGKLKSYHLKTCLLYLNERNVDIPWREDHLDIWFKGLIGTLIEFLENKFMPCFFNRTINLFQPVSNSTLDNLKNWLRRISRSDETLMAVLNSIPDDLGLAAVTAESARRDEQASGGLGYLGTAAVVGAAVFGLAAAFSYLSTSDFEVKVYSIDSRTQATYTNLSSSSTVRELKTKIFSRQGIPVYLQRLTYNGRVLENSQTLGEYGIKEGSTVKLH